MTVPQTDQTPTWGTTPPPSQPPKPPLWRRPWAVITGCVLVGITGLGILGATMDAPTADVQQPQPTVTAPDTTPVTKATTGAVAAPETTDAPATTEPAVSATTKPPVTKPELTAGQEQAVGSAQDYLATGHFSRAGLIKQLSSPYGSDFSKADATFAVNYLHVNWREQAVGSAQEYLATSHFSRAGLIEQLSSPYGSEYTRAEAIYAVNKVGL